jgi:hypothetical protein
VTHFPKKYASGQGPAGVLGLINLLLPQLLEGDHPVLAILREQYRLSEVGTVELTGVGFFADLEVPPDVTRVEPASFAGGDANIELVGVQHGAGCVLFVRDGRLSLLEGYTHAGEEWAEDAVVLSVGDVLPIQPANPRVNPTEEPPPKK